MPTQAKKDKVAQVRDYLERSESYFITTYQGLNVADISDLRAKLRECDARMLVEKNTLIKVAVKEMGIEGLDEHLVGSTAITFAFGDPVGPAKALSDSFKKCELPVVKVFSLAGELMLGSRLSDLADLPSRDELLAQVIGAIEGPIAEVFSVMDAVVQEFVGTVDALAAGSGAGSGTGDEAPAAA